MKDENKPKKRSVFNLFDIVVLLVIVVLAAVLIMIRSGGAEQVFAEPQPIHYTLELTSLINGSGSDIKVGDQLMDRIAKYDIGVVEEVEVTPMRNLVSDLENGTLVLREVPDHENVYVTLSADAIITDTEITVSTGYIIRVGSSVSVSGPGYQAAGTIVAIRED